METKSQKKQGLKSLLKEVLSTSPETGLIILIALGIAVAKAMGGM